MCLRMCRPIYPCLCACMLSWSWLISKMPVKVYLAGEYHIPLINKILEHLVTLIPSTVRSRTPSTSISTESTTTQAASSSGTRSRAGATTPRAPTTCACPTAAYRGLPTRWAAIPVSARGCSTKPRPHTTARRRVLIQLLLLMILYPLYHRVSVQVQVTTGPAGIQQDPDVRVVSDQREVTTFNLRNDGDDFL